MKQKGIVNITSVMIGVIIAVGIFMGMFNFYEGLYDNYNQGEVNETFRDEMKDISDTIASDVEEQEETFISKIPILGDAFEIVANGWKAIGIIFDLPKTLMRLVSAAMGVTDLGGAEWIYDLINAVIWIIVFAAIIKAVFKREI